MVKCKIEESDKTEKEFIKDGWKSLATFNRDNGYKEFHLSKNIHIDEDSHEVKIYFNSGHVDNINLEESEVNKLISNKSNYINYWKVEKLVDNDYKTIFEELAPKEWKDIGWDLAMKNVGKQVLTFS